MTPQTVSGPFGSRQLSDSDWKIQGGKMIYLRLKKEVKPYDQWKPMHFDLVAKYALNCCTDWFYHSDDQYVFGCFDDYVLVKLWVSNNNMIHQQSEITIP